MRAADECVAKWDIELYAKSISSFKTCTACNAGWYLENFRIPELAQAFGGFPLFEDAEGYMTWHIPHWGGPDLVPWISIRDDWGDMIQGVFLNPEKWNGKTLQGVSDPISFGAMCEQFQQGEAFFWNSSSNTKRSRILTTLSDW